MSKHWDPSRWGKGIVDFQTVSRKLRRCAMCGDWMRGLGRCSKCTSASSSPGVFLSFARPDLLVHTEEEKKGYAAPDEDCPTSPTVIESPTSETQPASAAETAAAAELSPPQPRREPTRLVLTPPDFIDLRFVLTDEPLLPLFEPLLLIDLTHLTSRSPQPWIDLTHLTSMDEPLLPSIEARKRPASQPWQPPSQESRDRLGLAAKKLQIERLRAWSSRARVTGESLASVPAIQIQ